MDLLIEYFFLSLNQQNKIIYIYIYNKRKKGMND